MKPPKHILVIRLSAMGDVAMVVPVLRCLIAQYPLLKISVVTQPFFKPFFRDIKNVSVLDANIKGKHKGIFGLYKLSKTIKTLQVDAIADLHNVLRSQILKCFLLGKPFKQIDKGRSEKKALVRGDIFLSLKTTHQRYLDVFATIGLPVEDTSASFPEPSKLSKKLKDFIGINSKKTIGIAPFATYKSKMYPLDKMATVIKELSKRYNVLLFGSAKEAEMLQQICTDDDVVVAGKLSLSEELDLISNLDVMLSMDSSNAHMAAMLGVKVITIWGVTHPYVGFAPYQQPLEYALMANRERYPLIPTSVYGNKYPKNYENAAGSIDTESVVTKVKTILGHKT